jgi:hypothetical protein
MSKAHTKLPNLMLAEVVAVCEKITLELREVTTHGDGKDFTGTRDFTGAVRRKTIFGRSIQGFSVLFAF